MGSSTSANPWDSPRHLITAHTTYFVYTLRLYFEEYHMQGLGFLADFTEYQRLEGISNPLFNCLSIPQVVSAIVYITTNDNKGPW